VPTRDLSRFDLAAILRAIHSVNASKQPAGAAGTHTALAAHTSTRNNSATTPHARLDARDLTDLLEELALLSRCTEFYHRFVRSNAAYAESLLPPPTSASREMTALRSARLVPLAFSADTFLVSVLYWCVCVCVTTFAGGDSIVLRRL
jgi:hypothetical protein